MKAGHPVRALRAIVVSDPVRNGAEIKIMHLPELTRHRSARRILGPARRVLLMVALLAMSVPVFVGATTARADDVSDLDVRARQIAVRLDQLQGQVAQIGEQFNQLQIRRQELASQQVDLKRRRAASRRTVAARRADAARFALAAYVGGNGDDVLPLALDGRQWDLTRRNGYAAIEIGDRQQVVDDLVAAQKVDADLLDSIHDATREQEQVASDLERRQAEATRLIEEQERLQSQVKGELAAAVARQQAALQAKAEAEAQARLEQRFGAPPGTDGPVGTTAGAPTTTAGSTSSTPPTTTRQPGTGSVTPTSAPPSTAPPATTPPVTIPSVTPPPPPSSGGKGQIAANAALSQLGVRYSWGGGNASGPSYGFGAGAGIKGFDCSGLTLYAWAQAGVSLYHSAQMQYDLSSHLSISQLQVGDLVFYGTSSRDISHVGLYIGNGQVVHAPNSRSVVQTGPVYLWSGYFAWVGAGRPG